MKHLFSRWEEGRRALGSPEKVIWFFDFDGTLAPLARHPQNVKLPRSTKRLLEKLLKRHPRRVGILSGRPVKQVVTKVGIPGLIYAGTHGYEVQGPRIRLRYKLSSVQQKRMRKLAKWIQDRTRGIPGLWLEDKWWTICVHYREVRPKDMPQVMSLLGELRGEARQFRFIAVAGHKTLEVFPGRHWNKGKALAWIQRQRGARGFFYVGDDSTDETVFREGGRHRMTVRIGHSAHSRATYYVTQQEESPKLLERILSL